ncbi:pentatricopeptide repeat-containing protein At2g13600-like [Nymphaea colorata]|nr:pentatricopeptide repeat-containing protein At2g13600-like [Nymphaea colorata]
MEEAHNILAQMPESNVVSRNALIAGYVQNDQGIEAIDVFRQMQAAELKATKFTFSSVLVARDAFLGITLFGMYARCQTSEDACLLFRELNRQSTVSWTAIICGLIQDGLNQKALDFFLEMRSINVEPDHATFASILKACVNLAAPEDGKKLHSLIIRTGFVFNTHTSSALIDMYVKCGDIVSATAVFNTIDNHDIISWNAMITGFAKNGNAECAINLFKECILSLVHGNELIAAHIAKKLMDVEHQSSYPYVLLSNLHASSGNWEEVSTMRKIMKEKHVNKFPGCSWIIIGDRTNPFVAGDKCHPESVEIYELLNSLSARIKEEDLVSNYE